MYDTYYDVTRSSYSSGHIHTFRHSLKPSIRHRFFTSFYTWILYYHRMYVYRIYSKPRWTDRMYKVPSSCYANTLQRTLSGTPTGSLNLWVMCDLKLIIVLKLQIIQNETFSSIISLKLINVYVYSFTFWSIYRQIDVDAYYKWMTHRYTCRAIIMIIAFCHLVNWSV